MPHTLEKTFTAVATLRKLTEIRCRLATIREEDLVAVDEFLADQPPIAMGTSTKRVVADLRTFARLTMFFRSEVASKCIAVEELTDMKDILQAEQIHQSQPE